MKLKTLILIFLLLFSSFMLSGCYSAQGLETLAYPVAIGIDKGEGNKIKLTLQIATLTNNNSGESGSSGGESSNLSTITSVECASIDSGISLINSYISKKINLSHCKAIIISEELAYEGISEYFFTLVNNLEIRPYCNIVISRCDASSYLENSHPTLESLSARYYEFIFNSSKYTGYIENTTLNDFYSNMLSTATQAYAILGGVNSKNTHFSSNNLTSFELEGSYKANETPIESENKIENMGIALFNNDKLVGELTGLECLCYLLISNKMESATISIPNPFNESSVLSLYITSTKPTKSNVKFVNGTPYISCDITITANVLSLDKNFDYSDENNLKLIEDYSNSYLEENISSFLYKTAKDFKVDVCNFGKFAIKNYKTWNDWIEADWLNNYQNSFFDINVNTTLQSSQLFTKI